MTVNEALEKLKALGNDKVRKHNLKFGASENQYGVKLGDIRALAKTIGSDHALAKALWKTGNVDAQLLATQILDVNALSLEELDEMVKSGGFSQVADWLNAYVVKEHPDKEKMREDWMDSDNSWAARAGWSLTAGRVVRSADGLNLPGLLDRIETEMPSAPPEVQWTMNTTLAQIGINHPDYRERALRIGETLGVFRDYPVSKGCTSPFAPIWISEMVKRQGMKN